MGDLFHETDAARAENAALIIEGDSWTEFHTFRFFYFFFEKTRAASSKLDAVFLELTFARLVANRAIERMINQKKLHHSIPAFLDHR